MSLSILVTACTSSTSAAPPPTQAVEVSENTSVVDDTSAAETTQPSVTVDQPTSVVAYPPSPLAEVTADLDGALLGLSTGLSRAERAPRFRTLEADAGRQFDIGHVFHAWDAAIPTEDDLMHL